MTATAHAAVGVTLAALIPNPVIGIPVALLSHVICDLIPHWDAGTHGKKKSTAQLRNEAIIDVTISFVLTFFLLFVVFREVNFFYGWMMVFSAQLFDWLASPYTMFDMKIPPFSWVYFFQKATNTRLDKPWGIITQTVAVIALILVAKLR